MTFAWSPKADAFSTPKSNEAHSTSSHFRSHQMPALHPDKCCLQAALEKVPPQPGPTPVPPEIVCTALRLTARLRSIHLRVSYFAEAPLCHSCLCTPRNVMSRLTTKWRSVPFRLHSKRLPFKNISLLSPRLFHLILPHQHYHQDLPFLRATQVHTYPQRQFFQPHNTGTMCCDCCACDCSDPCSSLCGLFCICCADDVCCRNT